MAKYHDKSYEMYIPGGNKHSHNNSSIRNLSFNNILKRYVYFRIQRDVKEHLNQFLIIFIIGLVLNYIYFQTLSLNYLFIGGVNELFSVLIPTLNYGFGNGTNLLYLIINGIFYAYFYYNLVLVIYNTVINLDDKDTWIMIAWFILIMKVVSVIFPQII